MTDPLNSYNFSLLTHTDKLRIVGQDLYLQTGVSTDAEDAASSTFENVQIRTVERFPDLIAGAIARLSDTQFTIVAADSADLVVGGSYQTPYAEEYYAVSELATVTLDDKSDPDPADGNNVTYTFSASATLADPLPHASACIVQTGTPDQLVVTKTLTLPPQDVDEAPHTLTLSGSHRVAENAQDAKVGDLGVTDAENDALRFHIASGGDGAEFEVRNASELYMALVPSHEANATLRVTVVAEQVQHVIDAARDAADPAAFNTATGESVDPATYIAFLRGIVTVIPASFLDDDGRKAAAIVAASATDRAGFNALAEMSAADDLTQEEFDALVGGRAPHPANSTFGEASARSKVVAKARETMTDSRAAFNGEKSTTVDEATYLSFLHDDTLDLAAVPTAWRDAALKVSKAFDITVDDVNEAPATPTLGNAQVNALQTAFVGLLTSSDPDDGNTVAFAKDATPAPTAPANATFADDAAFRQALIDAANAAEFNALAGMAAATALTDAEFATMQAGALNADAASFEVVHEGGFWKLRLTEAARTAQIATLSTPLRVRVKAYDDATVSLSSAYAPFEITVVHDSSAPFGLDLSPTSVDEHDQDDLTVGTLEAFNYEGSETLTFTLGTDTVSALFELDGAVSKTADGTHSATDGLPQKYRYTQTLKLKAALDADEAASRAVAVTVADSAGNSVGPTTFTVAVTNTLITPTSMSVNELAPGSTAGDLAYNGSATGARFTLENLTDVFEIAGIIASSSKVDSVTALVDGGAITSIEMQRKDKGAVWAGATEAERSAAKTLRASHERDFATAIAKAANGELTLPRSVQSDHFVSTTTTYAMLHRSGASATRIKALGAESAVVDGNALLRGGALAGAVVSGTGPFTLAGGVKLAFDFFVLYDAAGTEHRLGEAASLDLWRTQLGTKTGNTYVDLLPAAVVYAQCRLEIAGELLQAHSGKLFQADGTTAYSSDAATMADELEANAGHIYIQFDENLTATALAGTPDAAGIAPLSTTGPHVQVAGGTGATAFTRTYRNVWGAATPNTAAERFELFAAVAGAATASPAIVSYVRTEDDGVVVSGSSIPAGDITSVSVREYLLPQTASNSITLAPYEFVKRVEYNVSGAALDYLKVTTNRDNALEIGTRPAVPDLLESANNMIIGFSAFPTLSATTESDQQQGARLRLLDTVELRRAAAGAVASYDVRVKATTETETRYDHITVAVTNVNENPTAIHITHLTVSEGLQNAVVGTLSADDADVGIDANETLTFAIGTAGANDNDKFEIYVGTILRLKGTFTATLGTTYTVDVVVSDAAGTTFQRQLSIVGANYINDAPTGIDLSLERHVLADTPGFPIATLEAEDPDLANEVDADAIDESHTFTVVGATSPFDVDNTQTPAVLRVKPGQGGVSAASPSVDVTLRVVDAANASFTMAAPITLTVVARPQVASAAFAQTLEVQDVTLTLDPAPDAHTSFVSASFNGADVVGSSIQGADVTVPNVALTLAGPNAFAVNLSYAQPNDAASTFAFVAEKTVALNHVSVLQAELQAVEDALVDAGRTVAADDTGHDFAAKITELKERRIDLISKLRDLELTPGEQITIDSLADNATIFDAVEGYFNDELDLIDEIPGVDVVGDVVDGAALAAAVTTNFEGAAATERDAVKTALEQLAWIEVGDIDVTDAASMTTSIQTVLTTVEDAFLNKINTYGVTLSITGADAAARTSSAADQIAEVIRVRELAVRNDFKTALHGLHGISVSVADTAIGVTDTELQSAVQTVFSDMRTNLASTLNAITIGGETPISVNLAADYTAAVLVTEMERVMTQARDEAEEAKREGLITALKAIEVNGAANPLGISATTLDDAALGTAITTALGDTKTQLIGALQALSITAETFDAASSIETLINAKRMSLAETLVAAVPSLGIDALTAPSDEQLLAGINAALAAQRDSLVDLLTEPTAAELNPTITASGGAYVGLPATLRRGVAYTLTYPASHPLRLSETADGTHAGGAEYTVGVDASVAGTLSFTLPADAPDTLHFYCVAHPGMGATAAVVDSLPAYPTIDTPAAKADAGMLAALRAAMEKAEDAAEAARLEALVNHINARSAATGVEVTGTAANYADIEARLLAAFAAQRTELLTRLAAAGVTVTASATADLDALVTKIQTDILQGQRSALTGQLDSRIDLSSTDIHDNAALAQAISDAFDDQRKELLELLIPDPSDPSKGIPGFSIDVNSTNDADVFTAITAALTAKRTALIGETDPNATGGLTGLAAVLGLVPGVTVAADADDAALQEAVRQALIRQRQDLVDALGALQRTYTAAGGDAITITTDPNAITATADIVEQVRLALVGQRTRLATILDDMDGVSVAADQHSNADLRARVEAAIGDSRVDLREAIRVGTDGAVDIDEAQAGDTDFAGVINTALDTQREGLVDALVNNISELELADIADQGDNQQVQVAVSNAINTLLTNQQEGLVTQINAAIAQLHPTITAIDLDTTPANLYTKLVEAFNTNHAALVDAVHNVDGVQVLVNATGVPGLATAIETGYATQRGDLVEYLEQNVPDIVFTYADPSNPQPGQKTKEEIGAAIGALVENNRTLLIDALTHPTTGIPGFNTALAGGTDAAAIKLAIQRVMANQRSDMVAAINADATLSGLFTIGDLHHGDADLIMVLTAAFETRRNNLAGALNAALPGFSADLTNISTLDAQLAAIATQALDEQDSRLRATLASAGITFASGTTSVVDAVQSALVELRREFAVKMDSIPGITIAGLDSAVGGAAPPELNVLHDLIRDEFAAVSRNIVQALDDVDGINIAHNVVDPATIALAAQTGLIALRSGVITALSALPQFDFTISATNTVGTAVDGLTRAEYETYVYERAADALQTSMDDLVTQLNTISTADGVSLTINTVGSAPTLVQRYAAVRAAVEDALATQRSGLLQALQAGSVPGLVIDLAKTQNADLVAAISDAAANRRDTLSQALNAGVSGLNVAADVSDAALATAISELMTQQRSDLVSALNATGLVTVSASGDAIVTEAVQTALNNERIAIANAVADADPHITMPSTSTPPSNGQIAQAVANGVARRRDLLADALQGITNMPALGASGDPNAPVLVADATIRDGVVQAISTSEQTQRSGLVALLNGINPAINLVPGATDATIVDAVKGYAKDFVDHLSKAKLTVKFATGSTVWDEDDTFLLQQYDADYVDPAGTFTFWPTLGTPVEKSTHADETGEQTVFVSFNVTLAPGKRVRLYNTNHGTWVNVQ